MQKMVRSGLFIVILVFSFMCISGSFAGAQPKGPKKGGPKKGRPVPPKNIPKTAISVNGALNWEEAITFCEKLVLAGKDDWRLPNVKELHSIMDYSRAPFATDSASIDPVFNATAITAEDGKKDYPYYWSSTTHIKADGSGDSAAYIAFGRGLGYMRDYVDAHGAGTQRSDPKTGNRASLPTARGPQGDIRRVFNFARCVRDDGGISGKSYSVVDTDSVIDWTKTFGEDADYEGNQPDYTKNNDGTVTDNITGLMWVADPGDNIVFSKAKAGASSFNLGGHSDWRFPTIKELYSLILFSGEDASRCRTTADCKTKKFIDEKYFVQRFGDTTKGERVIDAQTWSDTIYVHLTMGGDKTDFGVNFVDGRIKGYPLMDPMTGFKEENDLFCRYVRGNTAYGKNDFADNGNGTVTDKATGLTWTKDDSGVLAK